MYSYKIFNDQMNFYFNFLYFLRDLNFDGHNLITYQFFPDNQIMVEIKIIDIKFYKNKKKLNKHIKIKKILKAIQTKWSLTSFCIL